MFSHTNYTGVGVQLHDAGNRCRVSGQEHQDTEHEQFRCLQEGRDIGVQRRRLPASSVRLARTAEWGCDDRGSADAIGNWNADYMCNATNLIQGKEYQDTATVRVNVTSYRMATTIDDWKQYLLYLCATFAVLLIPVSTALVITCCKKEKQRKPSLASSASLQISSSVPSPMSTPVDIPAVVDAYDDAVGRGVLGKSYEPLNSVTEEAR